MCCYLSGFPDTVFQVRPARQKHDDAYWGYCDVVGKVFCINFGDVAMLGYDLTCPFSIGYAVFTRSAHGRNSAFGDGAEWQSDGFAF